GRRDARHQPEHAPEADHGARHRGAPGTDAARMTLPRLYAIVDPLDTGWDPVALAEAFLAGGARLLQLRLKAVASRTLLDVAERIAGRARDAGATFLVNDRPDVARAVDADGVHLGQDDLP